MSGSKCLKCRIGGAASASFPAYFLNSVRRSLNGRSWKLSAGRWAGRLAIVCEAGLWASVSNISTRGRDTGDAQLFVNLVDNPRLDYDYTVWGRVLQGMEVVDGILEGDLIRRVEIRPPFNGRPE